MTGRATEGGDQPVSPFGARILGPADQDPDRLRLRIQLLLTGALTSINVIGSAVVFTISNFVVPSEPPTTATKVALAIAVPTYVLVAAVVGVGWGTASTLRSLRWATTDTEPTEAERTRALRVPMQLTAMQLTLWLIGTVVFTSLIWAVQPARAVNTAVTVTMGAVVAAGIAYLSVEFALRPLSARALAGSTATHPRSLGVGQRMVVFWAVGTGVPVVGLMVAGLLALVDDETTLHELAIVTIVAGGLILVTSLVITLLTVRAIVAPIMSVRNAMRAVEAGDLDADVVVYDGTELGMLQSGFNLMANGLRERERIRDLFGRHVGHDVAAAAALDTGEIELGGEATIASVLFIDLLGSTAYATAHGPVDVVAMLNRFFAVVVDEVDRNGGLVNKFIGDAALAIFGEPVRKNDHAASALTAARAMCARLTEEVPEVGFGIGVATGMVVAGNVGHEQRYEYTVIGDAVNSAARLTDLAKQETGQLLAMWHTVEVASSRGDPEAAHWQRHGATVLRGRTEETALAVPKG
ncbi:adenylate/guanylate cyclase domain-containing protein [Nocardioides panacisoli]|uniref:Adenylate/guanylate cyclase domain-containing protein n=1 Tax=Nocardioides panacisoli TaxID=627624 RepID=A0ABP7IHA9_9ACTN